MARKAVRLISAVAKAIKLWVPNWTRFKYMNTWERERALHYQRRQKFDRELQSRGAEFSKYTHIRRQAYEKLAHTADLCLESLVFEQQKEFSGIKLTPFLSKDPKVFLAAYFHTERFQHTTTLAQQALRTAPSLPEFKGRLAGKLVEEMAYYRMAAVLSATGGNSGVVLAPDRTLEFYTSLHPGRKEPMVSTHSTCARVNRLIQRDIS